MTTTPILTAIAQLDERLREVIAAEARRANRLAPGDDSAGWQALADMTRAPVESLCFDAAVGTSPLLGTEIGAPLARSVGLSALAMDVLLVAAAPYVEPRYCAIYDVLAGQPTNGRVTERLLLSVLGRTPERAQRLREWLRPEGRLLATGLLRAEGPATGPLASPLGLDQAVVDLLLGHSLPTAVQGVSFTVHEGSPTDARTPTVAVSGPGELDAALELVAPGVRRFRLSAAGDPARLPTAARALWRLAACHAAWPVVDLTGVDPMHARTLGEALHALAVRFGTPLALRLRDPAPWGIAVVEAPRPTWRDRRDAWRAAADRHGVTLSSEDAGYLATASRLGRARIPEVFEATRSHTAESLAREAARLSSGAMPHGTVVRPSRTFDDLVLADTTREALERLLHFVRQRDSLSERCDLEHRFRVQRGPIALFSGRPGTGKTLSAEVIARALGRPLHVVDLSQLVSKFIGETEKHIDEVLRAGESSGAVLLFDEADTLFAKRTDVSTSNDRFANLEVGYLLQRIEHHDGLVILSTNLKRSVDDAFLRRFHSRIEFPMPSAPHRARLWQLMLPPAVPRGEDLDTERLASAHRLSGGEIRNAALKAIFMAEREGRPVDDDVLDRAVAIELLELGRLSRRAGAAPDLGGVAQGAVEALADRMERHLAATFLKEVHLVHGPPTREAMSGKHPAASLAVYQLVQARDGTLRLGVVVSAWCARPEEEHTLLGVLHQALAHAELPTVEGKPVAVRVAESFDFDLLHRFWSSHSQPVRASIVLDVVVGESTRRSLTPR